LEVCEIRFERKVVKQKDFRQRPSLYNYQTVGGSSRCDGMEINQDHHHVPCSALTTRFLSRRIPPRETINPLSIIITAVAEANSSKLPAMG